MTIWRMRIAFWITKATNTNSEYVLHIDFSTATTFARMRLNVTFIHALPVLFGVIITINRRHKQYGAVVPFSGIMLTCISAKTGQFKKFKLGLQYHKEHCDLSSPRSKLFRKESRLNVQQHIQSSCKQNNFVVTELLQFLTSLTDISSLHRSVV